MAKNDYIEEQKKFNAAYGINFSIDDHQISQKKINALNNLMFEIKGSNDKAHIYVCNQFQNTVSEIDPTTMQVVRTARVLREPRSAVFSSDGIIRM